MEGKIGDLLLTLFACCVAGVLFFLFYSDVNKTSLRAGESFASITFKRNDAQRLFDDSYAWERIQNHAPLYDGDTIRTGNHSEARIHFDDSSVIELEDNTLIKLSGVSSKERIVDFLGGNIFLQAAGGIDALPVQEEKGEGVVATKAGQLAIHTQDGSSILVEQGAGLNLIQANDLLTIGVDSGQIEISKNGEVHQIDRTQELCANVKTGEIQIINRAIFPLTPAPNGRLLAIDKEKLSITFLAEWDQRLSRGNRLSQKENTGWLHLSPLSDFSEKVSRFPATIKDSKLEATLSLGEGSYYWRMSLDGVLSSQNSSATLVSDESFSATRKITIMKEKRPKVVYPNREAPFQFRRQVPEISFSWVETPCASAYWFEVSTTPDFSVKSYSARCYTASLRLSRFRAGNYYWRVRPIYSFTREMIDNFSDVGQFSIIENGAMIPVALNQPVDNQFYEIEITKAQGLAFSWQSNIEAVKYETAFFKSNVVKIPVLTKESDRAYVSFQNDELVSVMDNTQYFWAVRWQDVEGNFSEWSDFRRISFVDALYSQRIIYPPQDYTIAESLIRNTRFTWRSNLPVKKHFQLSSDPQFSSYEYDEEVKGETFLGKNWRPGKWYWRIRAFNPDGTVALDSKTSSFLIIAPFDEPKIESPKPRENFVFRKNRVVNFVWQELPHAEYYSIEVTKEGRATPVFAKGIHFGTTLDLDLKPYGEGKYHFSIFGERGEKEGSTRISGLISEVDFSIRELKPIYLYSPANRKNIAGLEALREGVTFSWRSGEKLKSSKLIIAADRKMNSILYVYKNPAASFTIPRFPGGRYYWIMEGVTTSGYDIKSETVFDFTVEEIPLLPAPRVEFPTPNKKLDYRFFLENSSILFRWNAVSGANRYDARLVSSEGKSLFDLKDYEKLEYLFSDFTQLEKGKYQFIISAFSVDGKGLLTQGGKQAIVKFTIDLPTIENAVVGDVSDLYGN